MELPLAQKRALFGVYAVISGMAQRRKSARKAMRGISKRSLVINFIDAHFVSRVERAVFNVRFVLPRRLFHLSAAAAKKEKKRKKEKKKKNKKLKSWPVTPSLESHG